MCGIVGYIGREPRAHEVLIDGLRRLDRRAGAPNDALTEGRPLVDSQFDLVCGHTSPRKIDCAGLRAHTTLRGLGFAAAAEERSQRGL